MSELLYLVGDLETYYDSASGYTLRKMDTPSYILDRRFETIGSAFKVNGQKTGWIDGPDVPRFLASLGDPSRVVLIAHNLLFDGCIFAWRYGWVAGFYVDTLALSRALLGHMLLRHDLDSVARHLQVGTKGNTVHKVNGMNRQMIINAGFYQEYADYSCLDADLAWGIFQKLATVMPPNELVINDIVHRMAIEPVLKLDPLVLAEHLAAVQHEKERQLATVALAAHAMGYPDPQTVLMSNDKFADMLRSMGVTPPTKISLSTNQETYAFAKTDEGMKDLLEHPDLAVQTLVSARLGVKSTIEESRTKRLLNISTLTFPGKGLGTGNNVFPVPLKPSGAHTHRLSGDWKINPQNMSRAKPMLGKRAMIRESVVTPEGYSMVVADESQVELRGTAEFCGQKDLLALLREGGDPYCKQGTSMFGRLITKADFGERFVSKQNMLSCQYQVGWRKYQARVRHVSLEETGTRIDLSDVDAAHHVNVFRADNYNISGMWKTLQYRVIPSMTDPRTDYMLGPVRVMHDKIVLPNGMCLHYRNLHKNPMTGEWQFTHGRFIKKLYGGKLLENIIQALCRIITMNVALAVRKEFQMLFNSRCAMQAHDELLYVCEDRYAVQIKQRLEQEMRRSPDWWPNIPLNCEAAIGTCYGRMK